MSEEKRPLADAAVEGRPTRAVEQGESYTRKSADMFQPTPVQLQPLDDLMKIQNSLVGPAASVDGAPADSGGDGDQ